MPTEPIRVDHVIVCCNGCGSERTIWPDVALVGAEEIISFIRRGIAPCSCGASTCNLAFHVLNPTAMQARQVVGE